MAGSTLLRVHFVALANVPRGTVAGSSEQAPWLNDVAADVPVHARSDASG